MTRSPNTRDSSGRFAKGNPGKRSGTRNSVTRAVEGLMEGEAEGLTRKAIELALDGDLTALRLCLDRIAPPRKGRLVDLPDMPRVEGLTDVPAALTALLDAMKGGLLSTEEADAVAGVLAKYVGAVQAADVEERLAELERRLAHEPATYR